MLSRPGCRRCFMRPVAVDDDVVGFGRVVTRVLAGTKKTPEVLRRRRRSRREIKKYFFFYSLPHTCTIYVHQITVITSRVNGVLLYYTRVPCEQQNTLYPGLGDNIIRVAQVGRTTVHKVVKNYGVGEMSECQNVEK